MRYHSNKNLNFKKDSTKSYVYVEDKDKGKTIGIFCWDYKNLRWRYNRYKGDKD